MGIAGGQAKGRSDSFDGAQHRSNQRIQRPAADTDHTTNQIPDNHEQPAPESLLPFLRSYPLLRIQSAFFYLFSLFLFNFDGQQAEGSFSSAEMDTIRKLQRIVKRRRVFSRWYTLSELFRSLLRVVDVPFTCFCFFLLKNLVESYKETEGANLTRERNKKIADFVQSERNFNHLIKTIILVGAFSLPFALLRYFLTLPLLRIPIELFDAIEEWKCAEWRLNERN